MSKVPVRRFTRCAMREQLSRHARPFQSLPTLHQYTAKEFARQRLRTRMSKSPVKPITHCAMREQRFPPCQTVSIISHTMTMHSKRVCPTKGSNLHIKITSQSPNPLRHARLTFPVTPDRFGHFPHNNKAQQKRLPDKGFEPAHQSHQSSL